MGSLLNAFTGGGTPKGPNLQQRQNQLAADILAQQNANNAIQAQANQTAAQQSLGAINTQAAQRSLTDRNLLLQGTRRNAGGFFGTAGGFLSSLGSNGATGSRNRFLGG